jgi:hypothetical protein
MSCFYTQMGISNRRPASVHVNQQVHLDLLPIRLTPPRKGRLFCRLVDRYERSRPSSEGDAERGESNSRLWPLARVAIAYSREVLARAADEPDSLPAGSAIERMLADWWRPPTAGDDQLGGEFAARKAGYKSTLSSYNRSQ